MENEKELQRKQEKYQNELNMSISERDNVQIKLEKANRELDKLRGDLYNRNHILLGPYKDLGSTAAVFKLGEGDNISRVEQDVSSGTVASLRR